MLSDVCATGPILIVESPPVQGLLGTVLAKERYDVILRDIPEARDMLSRSDTPIGLLITDQPWHFEPFLPALPVLYLSGAPDGEYLQTHRSCGIRFLQKPFRFEGLLSNVRELLSAAPAPSRRP